MVFKSVSPNFVLFTQSVSKKNTQSGFWGISQIFYRVALSKESEQLIPYLLQKIWTCLLLKRAEFWQNWLVYGLFEWEKVTSALSKQHQSQKSHRVLSKCYSVNLYIVASFALYNYFGRNSMIFWLGVSQSALQVIQMPFQTLVFL